MAKKLGQLFEVDGISLGTMYESMKMVHEHLLKDKRAITHWTSSGAGFSPSAARICKEYIQNAILTGEGYTDSGFPVMNERYLKMKGETRKGLTNWHNTGKLAGSFQVKSSRPSSAVNTRRAYAWLTLDPDAESPSVTMAGKKGAGVPVAEVFRWLEFGTSRMQARPLFSAALRKFVTINVPRMVNAVDVLIRRFIKENHNSKARVQGSAVTGDASSTMSASSLGGTESSILKQVISADVNKDFAISDATRIKGSQGAEYSLDDKTSMGELKTEYNKENSKMLKELMRSGYTQAQAEEFMKKFNVGNHY